MNTSGNNTVKKVVEYFESTISAHWDSGKPNTRWPWYNMVWKNEHCRWAHLEWYTTPKAHIVHLVVMPHTNSPAPIWGYDLISLNDQLTGLFMDITPVTHSNHITWPQPVTPRPIPDWADFFSDDFVCCSPSNNDARLYAEFLPAYLEVLTNCPCSDNQYDIKNAQARYLLGQRRNPQTRRMLQAHLRDSDLDADQFLDTVLFPLSGL